MAELTKLNSKRSSIKGRLTTFKNNLESLKPIESLPAIEIDKLSLKLTKFEALFGEFDDLQSEIETVNSVNLTLELAERDQLEQTFYHCIATAQEILRTNTPQAPIRTEQNISDTTVKHCRHQDDQDLLGFKLPIIKIPNFDGTYYKWLEFRDTFVSLVHNNDRIKDIHKFHYLNSYLEGDAARVISNFEITDKNYSEAWKILSNRYDNKRQLINNHLKSLFNIESIGRESERALRFITDHVTKNLRALSTLGQPVEKWDTIIIFMISSKLDIHTCTKWEEHRNSLSELPSLDEFITFLKGRADVLETIQRSKQSKDIKRAPENNYTQYRPNTQKSFVISSQEFASSSKSIECVICKGDHRIFDCSSYKAKSPEDRLAQAINLKLCHNCLRTGHDVRRCRLPGTCRHCKKRHNTMLHQPTEREGEAEGSKKISQSKSVSLAATSASNTQTLLCTALVDLTNPTTNETVTARALLDSASDSSFITEGLKSKLNLTSQPSSTNSVIGIGNTKLSLTSERCTVHLQSKNSSFSVILSCLVLPQISDKMPKAFINASQLHLSAFKLADPTFNVPSEIQMLIGADLFWELIGSKQHSLGSNNPILRSSKLGWLLAGPMQCKQICNTTVHCNFTTAAIELQNELSKFWELESFPREKLPLSEEERLCEKHFISNTLRLSNGRFSVKLPLKDTIDCLGDSYSIAKRRFMSLERRFKKQPQIKQMYCEFIHEYAQLGHLSTAVVKRHADSYYLPHHPVIKEKSETTKCRIVFDASARSSSGYSANDLQMLGPTIQDSLVEILVRFRQYKYVLSADIEKMYRAVDLQESDRNLQLILWRDNENEPLQTLQLNTVTYGFASASFLSTRCLWQLGEECEDQLLKTIIQHDFYVDDLLTGADSESQLSHIQKGVSETLAQGCFHLRKYRSNLQSLLFSDTENSNFIVSSSENTLGLVWRPSSDELNFSFNVNLPDNHGLSKRSILSASLKIFDPLGLLSLCTIIPKIIIQELWSLQADWDDPVPEGNIKNSWQRFVNNLHHISSLKIPRWVLIQNHISIEMHSFCDASLMAYGACVYLKSTDHQGRTEVNLLCAKARVAPIKRPSVARLELCGALVAAQLSSAVTKSLRCHIKRCVYWTDSTIVLDWLLKFKKGARKMDVFVANRVSKISELTDSASWRHVPTLQNPADLLSRGVEPQSVSEATIWWKGPSFLAEAESTWPSTHALKESQNQDPASSEVTAFPLQVVGVPSIFDRFSKLKKLQRVVARILRLSHNYKLPNEKLTGPLQVTELENSFKRLVKLAQQTSFPKELALLSKNTSISSRSSLASLSPFLDSENILRVGGRIATSNYSYDKKHPILLDAKHQLTKLIFQHEHEHLMHAGPQHLLASIRDRIWPLGGRNLARSTARQCLVCRRVRGRTMTNIMGNLPAERLTPSFPFHTVGLDFGGPFMITDRKGRGCKITKCYLCIFICFRYKCIHLEAVSELSKDAFILCLKRFCSRRGKPKQINCDNGTNFVAACREINNFVESNKDSIFDFAADEGIEFSPVYAPHFGGLWEAGVKSAKYHIARILGKTHLTFEELSSLFAQVEAVLNSRPLCPLSPSPDDLYPLTPAHFLIGKPLMALPSPCLLDHNTNRLDRFQRLEQYKQHFWHRWTQEYISELQQRTKWRVKMKDLKIGDLVVLKDESPPLNWRLGRIQKIFPGSDGVPRVADVFTTKGVVRRALNRICLLPTADDENDS